MVESTREIADKIERETRFECRIRTDYAPANFTTIKHMAQNLIPKSPRQGTHSALGSKTAAWDDDLV